MATIKEVEGSYKAVSVGSSATASSDVNACAARKDEMEEKHGSCADAVSVDSDVIARFTTAGRQRKPAKRKRRTIEEMEEKYQHDCMTFLAELFAFTREAVETFDFPRIGGILVDLFHLYNTTTQLGGYAQVEKTNQWDTVLRSIGLEAKHSNATIALKAIYQRYLLAFERHNLALGNFGAAGGDEDSTAAAAARSSHVRPSQNLSHRSSSTNLSHHHYNHHHHLDADSDPFEIASLRTVVPLDYNEEWHFTSLRDRADKDLSCDLRSWHPPNQNDSSISRITGAKRAGNAFVRQDMRLVDDLYVRLLSALPNEVEFAFTVLLDLFVRRNSKAGGGALQRSTASATRKQLLSHGFHVLDAVLATVGVIADDRADFAGIFELFTRNSKLNFAGFWRTNIDNAEILDLLNVTTDANAEFTPHDDKTINSLRLERILQWEDYQCELGRVHQVLAIILSVQNYAGPHPVGRRRFSQHNGVWKLAFLSSFCHRIATVRQAGVRLLQNLLCMVADVGSLTACENVYNNKWVGDFLAKTVSTFIVSPEFELVFESLDMLAHLVRNRHNERFILELCDTLNASVDDTLVFAAIGRENLFERLYNLLMLHDATLTVLTLEIFYHLSSFGAERICRLLYETTGFFTSLIRLLNVSANMLLRSDRAVQLISFNVGNTGGGLYQQQVIAMQPPSHATFAMLPAQQAVPAQNVMYFRPPPPSILPVGAVTVPSVVASTTAAVRTNSMQQQQHVLQQSAILPTSTSVTALNPNVTSQQSPPLVIATGFPPRIINSSSQVKAATPVVAVTFPQASASPTIPSAASTLNTSAVMISSTENLALYPPIPAGTIVCMQKPAIAAEDSVAASLRPSLAASGNASLTTEIASALNDTDADSASTAAESVGMSKSNIVGGFSAPSDSSSSFTAMPLNNSSRTSTPTSHLARNLRSSLSAWPIVKPVYDETTDAAVSDNIVKLHVRPTTEGEDAEQNRESLQKLTNWIDSVIISLDDTNSTSTPSSSTTPDIQYNPVEDDVVHVTDVCTLAAIDLNFMPMPSPFSVEEAEVLKVFEHCFRRARPNATDSMLVHDDAGRLTTIQRHRLVYDRARMTPDELARLSMVSASTYNSSRSSGAIATGGAGSNSKKSKKRRCPPTERRNQSGSDDAVGRRLKPKRLRSRSAAAGQARILVHSSAVGSGTRVGKDAAFLAAMRTSSQQPLGTISEPSAEMAENGNQSHEVMKLNQTMMSGGSSESITLSASSVVPAATLSSFSDESISTSEADVTRTLPVTAAVVDADEKRAAEQTIDNTDGNVVTDKDIRPTPIHFDAELTEPLRLPVAADAQPIDLSATASVVRPPPTIASSRLAELLLAPAASTTSATLAGAVVKASHPPTVARLLPATTTRPSTLSALPLRSAVVATVLPTATATPAANSPTTLSRVLPAKPAVVAPKQPQQVTVSAANASSGSALLLAALTNKQSPPSASSGISKLPLKKNATFIMTPPVVTAVGNNNNSSSGNNSPRSVSRASGTTPQLFASLTTASSSPSSSTVSNSFAGTIKRPRSAMSTSEEDDEGASAAVPTNSNVFVSATNRTLVNKQPLPLTSIRSTNVQNQQQTLGKRLFGTGLPLRTVTAGAVKNLMPTNFAATVPSSVPPPPPPLPSSMLSTKRLVPPIAINTAQQTTPKTLGGLLTNLPKLGSSSTVSPKKPSLTNLLPVSSKSMLIKHGQKLRKHAQNSLDPVQPPTPYIMGGGFSGNLSKKTILVSTRTNSNQLITANVARVLAKPQSAASAVNKSLGRSTNPVLLTLGGIVTAGTAPNSSDTIMSVVSAANMPSSLLPVVAIENAMSETVTDAAAAIAKNHTSAPDKPCVIKSGRGSAAAVRPLATMVASENKEISAVVASVSKAAAVSTPKTTAITSHSKSTSAAFIENSLPVSSTLPVVRTLQQPSFSTTPAPRGSSGLAQLLSAPIPASPVRPPLPPPPATRPDVFNSLMRRGIVKFRALPSATPNASAADAAQQPPQRKLVMYVREPLVFCEWSDCLRYETNEQNLFWHVVNAHLREDECDGICRWFGCPDSGQLLTTPEGITVYQSQILQPGTLGGGNGGAGPVVRGRGSLIAHIQDVHCAHNALRSRTEENIVSLRENRPRNLPGSTFSSPMSTARIMSAVLHQQQQQTGGKADVTMQATQSLQTQFMQQTRAYEQAESIKNFIAMQNDFENVVTRAIKLTATLTIKNLLTQAEKCLSAPSTATTNSSSNWALQLKKDLLLHEDELRAAASRTNSECAPFVAKLLKRLRTTDIGREAVAVGGGDAEQAMHACLFAPNVWTSFHELLYFDDDAENIVDYYGEKPSGGLMKRQDCAVVVKELLNLM